MKEIEALQIEGGHELVRVNDGSRDASAGICRELLRDARLPITFVNHARNYREHNAPISIFLIRRGFPALHADVFFADTTHLPTSDNGTA